MKSAIEEIYRGTFGAQDPDFGKEYSKALDKEKEKADALLNLIKDNAEAVKLFEEYQNAEGATLCIEVLNHYKQGFRHGFRVVLDALEESN